MKFNPVKRLAMRHRRVRAKISGTALCPRLSVSRSRKHIQAQLIDDERAVTMVSASDLIVKAKVAKAQRAKMVGADLAKKALAQGIKKVVFDRGGHAFRGRVKELAQGAREGGLLF